jgi:hypothetical protein
MSIRPKSQRIAAALACAFGLVGCGSQQRDAGPIAPEAATLADAARPAAASTYTLPPGAPPLPADLLAVGSQEARDNLYCQALIYAENPDVSDALAPVDEALLRKAQALGFIIGEAGINLMVTEKAAHATHARALADAYAAQVEKDMKARTPRIALDDCNKRAAAVPMPE